MKQKTCHAGQSLIETIVIVGVFLLLVSGIVVSVTTSLGLSSKSKVRSDAVNLTKEGQEFMRNERDKGWDSFSQLSGSYCLGQAMSLERKSLIDCSYDLANGYNRQIDLTYDGSNTRMTVKVTVSWFDGPQKRSVSTTTFLTDWKSTL